MPNPKTLAAIAAAILAAAALTGRAAGEAQAVSASGTPLASPSPGQGSSDPRWGAGSAPKLDDYLVADVPLVTQTGTQQPETCHRRIPTTRQSPVRLPRTETSSCNFISGPAKLFGLSPVATSARTRLAGEGVRPNILCVKSPSGSSRQLGAAFRPRV